MGSPRPVKRNPRRRSDIAATVGHALQIQRLRRRMTQAQAAEKAGTSVKYMGEIERGEANATMAIIQAVADTVGWRPSRGAGRELPMAPRAVRLIRRVTEMQQRHITEVADLLLSVLLPDVNDPDEPRQEGLNFTTDEADD